MARLPCNLALALLCQSVLHAVCDRVIDTGAIYLFKPQLDKSADRQYDNLSISGNPAPVSAQVKAACDAFPGSVPTAYVLPTSDQDAARIILQAAGKPLRVFIHPVTRGSIGIANRMMAASYDKFAASMVNWDWANVGSNCGRTGCVMDNHHGTDWAVFMVA